MGFPINERAVEGVQYFPTLFVTAPSTTLQTGSSKVDMQKARKAVANLTVNTIAGSETITLSWQASILGGSTWVTLTSPSVSAATILTAQGSNTCIVYEMSAQQLQVYNAANSTTYRYVRPVFQCAVGSPCTLAQTAMSGPEEPMSNLNAATVLKTYYF